MTEQLSATDYEEVLADHRRLVRELDVLLNGDDAAKQASLCDIVGQLSHHPETLWNSDQNPWRGLACHQLWCKHCAEGPPCECVNGGRELYYACFPEEASERL